MSLVTPSPPSATRHSTILTFIYLALKLYLYGRAGLRLPRPTAVRRSPSARSARSVSVRTLRLPSPRRSPSSAIATSRRSTDNATHTRPVRSRGRRAERTDPFFLSHLSAMTGPRAPTRALRSSPRSHVSLLRFSSSIDWRDRTSLDERNRADGDARQQTTERDARRDALREARDTSSPAAL